MSQRRRVGVAPEHIAIGTATDPYQPAEKEYGVTRACLEELAKREGLSISITTKSNQIVRDLELLKRIAEKSALFINMTVSTDAEPVGAIAGAAGAAAGVATGGAETIAGCGDFGWRVCVAAFARDYGWRRRFGGGGSSGARSRGAVVYVRSTVFDAVVFESVHAFSAGEISTTGRKVPAVVCEEYVCAGRISEESRGTRSTAAREVRVRCAAMGRDEAAGRAGVAIEAGIGRCGRKAADLWRL